MKPGLHRVAAALGLLAVSCIVPDRDIQFVGGAGNPGAVRILERPAVPAQWTQWCLDRNAEVVIREDVEGGTGVFCPSVPETRAGGLISDPDRPFCVCPDGQRDARAPALWTIYAEDPDLDGDDPADTLYGVLLLDPDPNALHPTSAVAYQNYLEDCAPGEHLAQVRSVAEPVDTPDGGREFPFRIEPPVARNEAPQWAFAIDDATSEGIDLCNDQNGEALEPGVHTLQFMVTDRPFFSAERDGLERQQCGVPDIAAGATYAVTNYVFECLDGRLEENDDCDCEDVE